MFITATLAVACAFCWLRYETLSVLTIENLTGREITTLTAVWPDGGATCVHTLLPGEKVTMKYGNTIEGGGAELLLKFRDSSQWYHARALGYLDHASGGELDAVLDNNNVHPLCCTVPKVSE